MNSTRQPTRSSRWTTINTRTPCRQHWLRQLRENEVAILPGNAQVKDAVAAGRYDFGFSDTDDVNEALRDGKPVRLVVPDQGATEMGVFVIPNAVALIRGAPHPESGSKLMSYLLSPIVKYAHDSLREK